MQKYELDILMTTLEQAAAAGVDIHAARGIVTAEIERRRRRWWARVKEKAAAALDCDPESLVGPLQETRELDARGRVTSTHWQDLGAGDAEG